MNHTFAVLAYKESKYLPFCIESLLNQSTKSNIFISTSTPNDYIKDTANKYGIDLIVNEESLGIASDWQFAVDHVQTDYYTLAHQDDLYYPEYAGKLVPMMEDSIIAFCNYEETVGDSDKRSDTKLLRIKRQLLKPFGRKPKIADCRKKRSILKFGSPICCPSVMFNKKFVGDFKFNPEYKCNLDWDAWLTFADMEGAFSYSGEILMSHRIHEDSATTRLIADSGRAEEDRRMFHRLWPGPVAEVLLKKYSGSYNSNSEK